MKFLLKLFFGIVAVFVVAVLVALWIYRDIPAAVLEAKYATPPSKFVEVGGVRYHVRQEGQGPDVVLMHASFGNLFMWDGWVKDLSDRYRITRMDLIASGLTGPWPSKDYTTEELVASLHGLMQKLGLKDFHLVGTSSGGIFAFRYAGDYPDDIRSLMLINSAGLVHRKTNPNVSQTIPVKSNILARITPKSVVDKFVKRLIRVEDKATPEVLQTYYDMIMREGNREGILRGFYNYKSTDPTPWLSRIKVPTFVIWSDGSVLPVEESEEFIHHLSQVPTEIMVVKGGGHALPISHPDVTAQAAAKFWSDVDSGKYSSNESDDLTPDQ